MRELSKKLIQVLGVLGIQVVTLSGMSHAVQAESDAVQSESCCAEAVQAESCCVDAVSR